MSDRPGGEDDASADGDGVLTPSQRHEILDREIAVLTREGLRLMSRFHYVAILAKPEAAGLMEVYVDGHGRVRRK